jgi:hypothetical protein
LPNKSLRRIVEFYYNVHKINDDHVKRRDEKRLRKKEKLIEIVLPKFRHDWQQPKQQPQQDLVNFIDQPSKLIQCVSCTRQKPECQFHRFEKNPLLDQQQNSQQHHHQITSATGVLTLSSILNANKNSSIIDNKLAENNNYLTKEASNNHTTKPNLFNNNNQLVQYSQTFGNGGGNGGNITQSFVQQTNRPKLQATNDLCNQCWIYWKKYGSFKNGNEINSSGSP